MAVHSLHQLLDLLAGGIEGRAIGTSGGIQRPLHQFHGVVGIEPEQVSLLG